MEKRIFNAGALKGYLNCAFFVQFDDIDNCTLSDLSENALDFAKKSVKDFVNKAWDMVKHLDPSSVGHDLYLTQTHQGCGFWDGYKEYDGNGDYLTELAQKLKEVTLIKGDDGKLYFE